MNRFSNIVDKSNKKGTIRLATVLTILLILALVVIISVPTINFATMPQDEESSNLVPLDTPVKAEPTLAEDENNADAPVSNETEPELVASFEDTSINLSLPLENGSYVRTSRFGGPRIHTGVDLATLNGTRIYASADGKVIFSKYDGEYGNRVIIEHSNSLSTSYSQCSELLVKEGDTVKAGDLIAKVGATGNSTGPHLHFEVIKDGNCVNPEDYLSF